MLAPPTEPFDVPLWAVKAKVHPDHHVEIARALYSLPTLYRGKDVTGYERRFIRASIAHRK